MSKLSKKVISVALAIAVAASSTFGGTATAQIKAASSSSSQYAAATLTVKFKRPAGSTSTPKIYAYDRDVDNDGKEVSGTSQALAGQKSPYQLADMTLDSSSDSKDWYTCDLNTRHGFAYVIIECGDKRYPTKENVDDNAFRITSSVAIDATQSDVKPVATTFPAITSTPTAQTKEVTIHFKKPSSWSGTPYFYVYYRPEGATAGSGTSQKPLGSYPGTKVQQETTSSNWYSYTFSMYTTGYNYYVKFVSSDEKNTYPKNDSTVTDNSYKFTGTSWFDSDTQKLTSEQPASYDVNGTPTPTQTATASPSTTPTVTSEATVTPSTDPTASPSAVPTATAEVTEVPTTTPTDVPTSSTPTNTITPDITTTPSMVPTTVPTFTPDVTATVPATTAPTSTPDAAKATQVPQTATDGAVNVNDNQNAATNVSGSAVTGSVIFSKTGKTAGEDVTIKISTKNKKSDAKYTYSYYVGSKAIAKNTTKTSVTWTTSTKGTYAVKVIIYENGTQTAVASAKYTVKARVITIKSLKTNKKSGQKKNTKIIITANATSKTGKASYKFAVQKGSGAIQTIKTYSSKKKVTWKPTQKGTYKLYVYVKNGKGVVVKKTITFKIK